MQHIVHYLDVNGLFVVKTSGTMDAQGFYKMADDLLKHSRWAKDRDVVFDHQDLDFSKVSFDDIEGIRDYHRKNEDRIGGGKSAIIVREGFLGTWERLWSQGEKIQSANIVKVFDRYDEAMDWMLSG